MTKPLAPAVPSAVTQVTNSLPPVPPPPPVRDRAYWTRVIHNAAQVPNTDPRYPAARAVVGQALDALQSLGDKASAKETPPPAMPDYRLGLAMNALQGLTAGFGDEALGGLAGLGTLLTGGGLQQAANRVQQTQQGFQEQRANFFTANPGAAIASDVAGAYYNPISRVLSPILAGTGKGFSGAVQGGVYGAMRGAGESTGGAAERGKNAIAGGVIGLVTGGLAAKALAGLRPGIRVVTENVRKLLGKGATAAEVNAAVEPVIRARLAKLGVAAEDIEQAVQNWRETGELSVRRPPRPPVTQSAPPQPTVRPGETITPISPKGFAVEGPAPALAKGPFPPTLAEMQGFRTAPLPDVGRGATMPYYPRGGAVEQAFGAPPASSPSITAAVAEQQLPLIQQFLQGATPADIGARVNTLRALGIALPPDAEVQLLQALQGVR